jgi:hypothetical protein
MAEFKLGRIRFVWKGDWNNSQTYYVDDVVKFGGKTYICVAGHSSSPNFYTDLDYNPTKWNQLTDGQDWKEEWATSIFYKEADIVKYGGLLYICNESHTSASTATLGIEADQSKWDLFAEGLDWKDSWTTNTRYKKNDLLKYGGYTYVCNEGHTSAATTTLGLEADQSKWDEFNEGLEYKGQWNGSSVRYKKNDVVKNGASLWIAITAHTSTSIFANDLANWSQFVEGLEFENDWNSGVTYQLGDVVRYGGNQYVAIINHTSIIGQTPVQNPSNWNLFSEGFRFQNDWSSIVEYKIGSVVRLNGYTYLAKTDSTNQEPPNLTYWERLNSGISWRDQWQDDVEYKLGDAVRFGANTYICILGHKSEGDDGSSLGGAANSRPDQDTTGTYWNILSVGTETAVLTTRGDIVYYSGSGPTRLPIGREGQILRAGPLDPEWVTLGETDNLYFVAEHGTDEPAPIHGKTWDKPFKTIRYACEQVEKGARNPNAQRLLELNRAFIQREVTAYIRYQIDNAGPGSIWENFTYDDFKCERDVGFIVDRLIHDLGQGGNLKIRAAVQTFLNALDDGPFSKPEENNGTGPYNNLAVEAPVSSDAYTYLLSLVEDVLSNEEPVVIYQNVTDDSSSIAVQYIDLSLTAESSAYTEVRTLVGFIITAFDTYVDTAGNDAAKRQAAVATIPARYVPQKLVRVATGRYRETLPIIVPAYTCVQGDELRSTNAGPAGSLVDKSDSYYTVDTFGHLETFIGDIVTGQTVSATAGNTVTQYQAWPAADTDSGVDTVAEQLVSVMQQQSDFRLNTMHLASLTDPVGYNSSYLVGYGDARKLLKENKKFLQEEVIEYLETNWASLEFTGSISGTTLTVTSVIRGTVGIGMIIRGDTVVEGTKIVSQISGTTGNAGTYQVDISQTVANGILKGSNEYSRTLTRRDTGYIIDALIYDLTYDGNAQSVVAGLAYWDYGFYPDVGPPEAPESLIPEAIKAATIAAVEFLKTRAQSVSLDSTITALQIRVPQYRDTAGSAGAATLIGNNIDDIVELIDVGPTAVGSTVTKTTPTPADGVNSTTALISASSTLNSALSTIKTNVINYLIAEYPELDNLDFRTKAELDIENVLEAVRFDFMFNSNYQTLKAAHAYARPQAANLFVQSSRIKQATLNSLEQTRLQAIANVGGASPVISKINSLMKDLSTFVYSVSSEGDICQTEVRNRDYAFLQLERNRDFIVAEIAAYIVDEYSDTATATSSTGNIITISDTGWLRRNVSIRFVGTAIGGLVADQTYFVRTIINGTTFTVGATRNAASAVTLTNDTGSMRVELVYDQALCLRDVGTYVDALKWDLKYTSNYKSRFVARYYTNAVTGSFEEDMYYLRDATGLRDQTLADLSGDVTTPNGYGTSRVTAGAYASLDPGWGPADFRTWILSRSPYVQGVTTFGNAAVGQKIDGALHNGGNDSIVSNDFTQVISDGIGAWVTNNGRAELVSVFSYYAHIGYLAENGGRIRGTNGNNSYGDFGSVAEGFDTSEIPNTGIVDNRLAFKATIDNVFTSGSSLQFFEFENAGIDYTEVSYTLLGGGINASVEADEFRDDATYQIRLTELAPSGEDGEFGGSGYKTNSNTAQGGTSTTITIAATDPESNTAYVGMRIVLTGGAGVGQYAYIGSFNSGTKVADIFKESELPSSVAGWDHFVPGTAIVSPDASTTYTIEPRLDFSSPGFSNESSTGLSSGAWVDAVYGETDITYTSLSGTYSGSGAAGAQFTVVRNGWKYIPLLQTAGSGYERLETVTIAGTSLGGLTPQNDLTITIIAINSLTGAILEFDHDGFGAGGRFVAVKGTSTNTGAYSNDGSSWISMTLPSTGNWTSVAHGVIQDSSTVSKVSRFVAVRSGSNAAAYSEDGITWTASTLPTSTNWQSVTFGNGRFVAISSNSTNVAVSLDGEVWDITGTLPSSGFLEVTYGKGVFVVVKNGNTGAAAYSPTGVNWTAVNLPANTNWQSVTFGKNLFVAVSSNSNSGAYSANGISWTAMTLGSLDGSTVAGYQKVRYGQGLFMATAFINGDEGYSFVATSETGIRWTARGVNDFGNNIDGYRALAFGNPQRTGRWVAIQAATGSFVARIRTGATTIARASVADERIFIIKTLEPGSGYDSAPSMTIVDPNNTFEAPFQVRIGSGVLANPTFLNRGSQYATGSAEVNTGDGYADFYQAGSFVAVRRLTERPVPGSNVVFDHLPNRTFKLVNVVTFLGNNDGAYTAFFQVSPALTIAEAPEDKTEIVTRLLYSQVRLTGHDFLDIGTGSFEDTNYPDGIPANAADPSKETVGSNGGRVFFTATDQDGNFRVGDLFSIEQSTGIATLNADAFNISGLQELNLGNVTLGGGSATITEFSTDPFFTADSDNIVPTQRAIKAFIASQIGGGGASINVNSVTAGSILINTNQITTVSGTAIKMNAVFDFRGGVIGLPIAFNYFLT